MGYGTLFNEEVEILCHLLFCSLSVSIRISRVVPDRCLRCMTLHQSTSSLNFIFHFLAQCGSEPRTTTITAGAAPRTPL